MQSKISVAIERFETWLKPSLFFFLLALLVLLNLIVWFGWEPLIKLNGSSSLISGLRAERDRLEGLLASACTSADLRSYGLGESAPPPPPGTASVPNSRNTPQGDLVSLLQSATVVVVHSEGSGSGFFIDPTTIVTNRHVIEGVKGDTVLIGSKAIGKFLRAKITSVTRGSDIGGADFALLRLEQPPGGIKVLTVSVQPSPLQHVIAVGFPGSAIRSDQSEIPAPIYTTGDVSAVQPQSSGVAFIIHTADISPGSSGGALVDRCGSVVGVNTFVQSSDSRAEGRRLYALSANALRKFLDSSGQRYTIAGDCPAGQMN